MSQQLFVDRDAEMMFLEDHYRSDHAELLVISGRRRVGKTELIIQFMRDKPGVYFLASEEGDAANIRDFSLYAARLIEDPNFASVTYGSWAALFESLLNHRKFVELSRNQKIVLALDEYPALIAHNRAIPSVFQKLWDQSLSKAPVMLILSGSSISIMETAVLGYASPLYGRRTGQWQVEPLRYSCVRQFLPWPEEAIAFSWFVLGGIPGYLRRFDPDLTFQENVITHMLRKGAYLYSEAEILLNYEFREPGNYMSIFRAVAMGCTTAAKICMETGLDKSMVSKYLHVLTRLHIIREEIPVTASPEFRRRQYRIMDPYLHFWFRFIYPNRIDLEAGRTDEVMALINRSFPLYCGELFEDLVSELVRDRFLAGNRRFTRLGRWWHKESEIDLVGLDEDTGVILFFECKWSSLTLQEASSLLSRLKKKAEGVRWRNDTRSEQYCLVARSVTGKEELRKDGFLVYDLIDIAKIGMQAGPA